MTNGLTDLLSLFVREKQFLSNLSPKTITLYKEIFARYEKFSDVSILLTQTTLDNFVLGMREHGLSVTTCNISIKSFNSFLSWLCEKGHIGNPRLKKLKQEKRVMKTLEDKQVKTVLGWKPNHKHGQISDYMPCFARWLIPGSELTKRFP